MGYPMAGHLAAAGHEVCVYNRTASKSNAWHEEFVLKNGKKAVPPGATPREAVRDADIVFCCVGNDADLRSVVLGDDAGHDARGTDGAFAGMKPGAIFVDHTTASASVARELHAAAKSRGLAFIDAPVSGGQAGAQNGLLTVMCGGDQATFDAVRPTAMAFSRAFTLLGDSGAGQLAKMVRSEERRVGKEC